MLSGLSRFRLILSRAAREYQPMSFDTFLILASGSRIRIIESVIMVNISVREVRLVDERVGEVAGEVGSCVSHWQGKTGECWLDYHMLMSYLRPRWNCPIMSLAPPFRE